MSAHIRRATAADAGPMADVELGTALVAYAGYFPEHAPAPHRSEFVQRWDRRIAADGQTAALCALEAGRIVGTACGQPDPDDPDSGYLGSLYVVPELWGHGIGRRLHDGVLDHLLLVGFTHATLWVIEQNSRSRALYESWGWEPADGRREAFGG